jgi:hypothetical protein
MNCENCPVFKQAVIDACDEMGLEPVYEKEAETLHLDDETIKLMEFAKDLVIFWAGNCPNHFNSQIGKPMTTEPQRQFGSRSGGAIKG